MILVYSLLIENKERLVNDLVQHLRGESRLYVRISRAELKELMRTLLEAYCEFLISGNAIKLQVVLGYWFRSQGRRSIETAVLMKAPFGVTSVVRRFLQEAYRSMPEQDASTFNKAMKLVESSVSDMLGLCVNILAEQQSLPQQSKQLGMLRYGVLRA